MQVKMLPNIFVTQAGTQKQCRRVDRAAGSDHDFRSNCDATTVPRASVHAGGRSSFDTNAQCTGLGNQSSASVLRIGKPSLRAGLLCTKRAAVTAVTANFALLAADNVARHGRRMPAQVVQSALENLLTCRHAVVVKVHGKPRAHGIEISG